MFFPIETCWKLQAVKVKCGKFTFIVFKLCFNRVINDETEPAILPRKAIFMCFNMHIRLVIVTSILYLIPYISYYFVKIY